MTGRVIVDGDACPRVVKSIIKEIASAYGWGMIMVASFNHNIEGDFQLITVGNEPQSADLAVINLACRGDIVVTQDWGLAAVVLGKGGRAISPSGKIYQEERMDFLLEERHLKSRIRKGGGRTKGPAPRTKEDDERFRKALERLVENSSD